MSTLEERLLNTLEVTKEVIENHQDDEEMKKSLEEIKELETKINNNAQEMKDS